MYKIAWKDKNETKRDKSKTTRFLRILVRIFLIPLKIDPIKNEISFRFWSKPTMGHIILYWIPFFAIEVYTFYLGKVSGYTDHMTSNSSTVEIYSKWMTYILQIAMFLPLMTCYKIGKKKLSADLFLGYAQCPGLTWCNLMAIFFQFFGSLAHVHSFMYTCDLEYDMYITLLVLYIILLIFNAVFWALSAFILEIWMENLFIGKGKTNFLLNSNLTIENYIKLSESFGTLFLIFFSVIQIVSIVDFFLSISKIINNVSRHKKLLCVLCLFNSVILLKESLNTLEIIDSIGLLSTSGIIIL